MSDGMSNISNSNYSLNKLLILKRKSRISNLLEFYYDKNDNKNEINNDNNNNKINENVEKIEHWTIYKQFCTDYDNMLYNTLLKEVYSTLEEYYFKQNSTKQRISILFIDYKL